jgi:tRNA A37 threonylcarbamoyladenosine dehydratase
MIENVIKPNVYIDFHIIQNSNINALIEELKIIIGMGKVIIVWSKTHMLEEMLSFCITNGLNDYIWDYKLKDAFLYSSVDFIIDNDKKLVDRFIRKGKMANYIERIE